MILMCIFLGINVKSAYELNHKSGISQSEKTRINHQHSYEKHFSEILIEEEVEEKSEKKLIQHYSSLAQFDKLNLIQTLSEDFSTNYYQHVLDFVIQKKYILYQSIII